jgi:hypothetical protein
MACLTTPSYLWPTARDGMTMVPKVEGPSCGNRQAPDVLVAAGRLGGYTDSALTTSRVSEPVPLRRTAS